MAPFYKVSESCQIPDLGEKWELIFGRRNAGFFVEVGAYDGESFSNTSCLSDAGWHGLYLEPVQEFAEKCRVRHAGNAGVNVIETAVGANASSAILYLGDTLTTLSEQQVDAYERIDWAKGLHQGATREVSVRPLNDILAEAGAPRGFDLLVVDVEGFEAEVFAGFSLSLWSPRAVVVELEDEHPDFADNARVQDNVKKVRETLDRSGYKIFYKDIINTIYLSPSGYAEVHGGAVCCGAVDGGNMSLDPSMEQKVQYPLVLRTLEKIRSALFSPPRATHAPGLEAAERGAPKLQQQRVERSSLADRAGVEEVFPHNPAADCISHETGPMDETMKSFETFLRERVEEAGVDLATAHGFNQMSRDAWVAAKAASVPAGLRVLDVGAGTAPYRKLFAHCEFKTHDFAQYDGYKGREGTYADIDYVSDILDIPVPDGSFDVILCTEVLEHVPRPIEALAKMVRIAKPGGRLFITAPLGSGLHQEPFHFYGGYTDHWYRKFLEEFGCDVEEISPNHGWFAHLAQECARFSWTYEKHGQLHGEFGPQLSDFIGNVLSRYFYSLDDKAFMREFTVGFQVVARKRA